MFFSKKRCLKSIFERRYFASDTNFLVCKNLIYTLFKTNKTALAARRCVLDINLITLLKIA